MAGVVGKRKMKQTNFPNSVCKFYLATVRSIFNDQKKYHMLKIHYAYVSAGQPNSIFYSIGGNIRTYIVSYIP